MSDDFATACVWFAMFVFAWINISYMWSHAIIYNDVNLFTLASTHNAMLLLCFPKMQCHSCLYLCNWNQWIDVIVVDCVDVCHSHVLLICYIRCAASFYTTCLTERVIAFTHISLLRGSCKIFIIHFGAYFCVLSTHTLIQFVFFLTGLTVFFSAK